MIVLLVFMCFFNFSVAAENNFGTDSKCSYPETDQITGKDINKFAGCTYVDGNVIITTDSFLDMHPDQLEIFSTLRTITGFLNIEASHADFKNLSFFRHLEFIHGHTPQGVFYTLNIDNTSLESLELLSLKQIKGRGAAISYNKRLCYAQTIEWQNIVEADGHVIVLKNRESNECEADGLICDPQCSEEGCWGSGPDKCISCKSYQQGDDCVEGCDAATGSDRNCTKGCPSTMFEENGDCTSCHDQCLDCHGPSATECKYCKHFEDDKSCVEVCPESKYPSLGQCLPCPDHCQFGCTATNNGSACNKCSKHEDSRLFCTDNCPSGYFETGNSNNGILSCSLCHEECASCYAPGPDSCSSCKNVKLYKSSGLISSLRSFTCTSEFKIPNGYNTCEKDNNDQLIYRCYSEDKISKSKAIVYILTAAVCVGLTAVFVTYSWSIKNKNKYVSWKPLSQAKESHELLLSLDEETRLNLLDPEIPTEFEGVNSKEKIIKGRFLQETTFGKLFLGFKNDKKKRPIMIKVVHPKLIKDREYFRKNMLTISKLEHKYLVQAGFHLSNSNEMMFLRDLIPYGSVLDFIKNEYYNQGNKIKATTLLEWCRQIAEGMCHLEKNSIVHRDLAARNVMLNSDFSIKVKDFGILALRTPTYKEKATAWQAPECIKEQAFSHKSDVWAFGVTIYELLTFGDDPNKMKEFIEDSETASLEELRIKLPPLMMFEDGIYLLLQTCFFTDPTKRPTFKKLLSKLQEIVNNPNRYINSAKTVRDICQRGAATEILLDTTNTSQYFVSIPRDMKGDIGQPTSTRCSLGNSNWLKK